MTNIFGNIKKYPVLKSLANILNEADNKKYSNKVSSIINDYNLITFNIINKGGYLKDYLLLLVRKDFQYRIESRILPANIKTHLDNYIQAIYKDELKNKRK